MKVRVTVAEVEAVKRGLSAHGNIVIDIDPAILSPDEREEIVRDYHWDQGNRLFLANASESDVGPLPPVDEATVENVRKLLALRIAGRKQVAMKREIGRAAIVTKFLGKKPEDFFHANQLNGNFEPHLGPYWLPSDLRPTETEIPLVNAHKKAVLDLYEGLEKAWDEKQAAKKLAAEEEAARKQSQLADAVTRLGSESQRERWGAGVMPVAEAIGLIVAEAAKPLTDAGISIMDASEYHVEGSDQTETQKRTLNDEQWRKTKKIMTIMGGDWKYSYWQQIAKPDDYDDEVENLKMIVIRCEKQIGEIKVEFDAEI